MNEFIYYTLFLKQTVYANGALKPIESLSVPYQANATTQIKATGITSSRLEEVKTYNVTNPYIKGVNGVSEVTDAFISYSIDGISYTTYLNSGETHYYINPNGLNENNTVNHYTVKDEHDIYHDKTPVSNNIYVDRKEISVFDNIYKLSRIDSLDDLAFYFN